jgi:uncharacterized membrane-anchored protein YitT (DUF2179 family)
MQLWRIYTEKKNTRMVENLLNIYYKGYTLIKATGYWKGEKENSLIVEILLNESGTNLNRDNLQKIADEIKRFNDQQTVLITCQNINTEFI